MKEMKGGLAPDCIVEVFPQCRKLTFTIKLQLEDISEKRLFQDIIGWH
jgi:hypothetical protein